MRSQTLLLLSMALLSQPVAAQMAPSLPQLPATAQPAVAPTVPAGTLPAVEAPKTNPYAFPEAETPQVFSFGSAKYSILFTPAQVNNLRKALQIFETARTPTAASPNAEDDVVFTIDMAMPKETIQEPATYPSYHLSSVVYRAANDWTVWLNNTRITPSSNNGEVKVLTVQPDRVWFRWDPDYLRLVIERYEGNEWAPLDKVSHRLTDANTAAFDREKGMITFSLKPNQTFASGYFNVFEGRMPAPTMPERKADAAAAVLDATAVPPTGVAPEGAAPGAPAAAPVAGAPAQAPSPAAPAAPAPVVHENEGVMAPATADAINSLLSSTPTPENTTTP